MNANEYLKRFDAEQRTEADFSYLAYLQNRHMLRVPFENLDVIRKVPITLDLEKFYQKVVGNRRGGFCYELNGLFQWLLGQLGFQSQLIGATVCIDGERYAIIDSHAMILVAMEQPYVVDVGFGDSVRQPMPLTGEVVEDVSGAYRIWRNDQDAEPYYYLQKRSDDKWVIRYRFTLQPKELPEFAPMCHYNQTSPESHFTHANLATIATATGRLTLSGNALTITEGTEKTKRDVAAEQLSDVLRDCFGIVLQ